VADIYLLSEEEIQCND